MFRSTSFCEHDCVYGWFSHLIIDQNIEKTFVPVIASTFHLTIPLTEDTVRSFRNKSNNPTNRLNLLYHFSFPSFGKGMNGYPPSIRDRYVVEGENPLPHPYIVEASTVELVAITLACLKCSTRQDWPTTQPPLWSSAQSQMIGPRRHRVLHGLSHWRSLYTHQ